MEKKHIDIISKAGSLAPWQVENALRLPQDGATIPFISRYRKEATGSLDETQVTDVRDQYTRLVEMDKRRETILKSIEEQGKLTDELRQKIVEADTMTELEDLYLPYRPKKKTRASVARKRT